MTVVSFSVSSHGGAASPLLDGSRGQRVFLGIETYTFKCQKYFSGVLGFLLK